MALAPAPFATDAERDSGIKSPAERPLRIAVTQMDMPSTSKGGVAHQTHLLANLYHDRGHAVTVLSFSPMTDGAKYAHRVLPRHPFAKVLRSLAFAFALGRTDLSEFDVVHAMGDNYLVQGNTRMTPPVVRTMNGSAVDEMRAAQTLKRKIYQGVLVPLEAWGAARADYVTGISEATRARVPQVEEIVPAFVDVRDFVPGRGLDGKEAVPTLLFVGTRYQRKRGQWLADVWTRDILPHLPRDSTLWTVTDEPLAGDNIVNHGRVSLKILCDLYRRAWAFCLPSLYEGFGVPYIEAFASGTPAIATPNPGALEILGGGRHGVIAADDRLAGEIVDVLTNAARRDDLTARGLLRAQDYAQDKIVTRYEEIFYRLVAGRKSAKS